MKEQESVIKEQANEISKLQETNKKLTSTTTNNDSRKTLSVFFHNVIKWFNTDFCNYCFINSDKYFACFCVSVVFSRSESNSSFMRFVYGNDTGKADEVSSVFLRLLISVLALRYSNNTTMPIAINSMVNSVNNGIPAILRSVIEEILEVS